MRNTEFDIAILMMWHNKKLFVDDENEGNTNSEPPKKKRCTRLIKCRWWLTLRYMLKPERLN